MDPRLVLVPAVEVFDELKVVPLFAEVGECHRGLVSEYEAGKLAAEQLSWDVEQGCVDCQNWLLQLGLVTQLEQRGLETCYKRVLL